MTSTESTTITNWDGVWNVVLHGLHEKTRGSITIDGTSGAVRVHLDLPLGTGDVEAEREGGTLSWTAALKGAPAPLRFEVVLAGDEIYGKIVSAAGGLGAATALDGLRAGTSARIRNRIGSDAIAETLQKSGVEYVFAYAGGESGALERAVLSPEFGLKTLPLRTELGAAWASYGFNRVKRRAASAVSVWCVGALHASPVVYAAKQDSTPLVFFATEQSTAWDVRDILQDTSELIASLKPVAKYAKRLVNVEDVPLAVRQAVLAASTGKFGPAVLGLTHDVTNGRTATVIEDLVLPSPPAAAEPDVSRALELIAGAQRPVLLVGAGVHHSGAEGELRRFAEASGIPVVTSGPAGRGVLPDDHPLYAGDSTLWGGFPTGIPVVQDADLWIAVGYSFSQTATHSWSLRKPEQVIQVDVEESQIGRIFQPTLGIVADAKTFLGQLADRRPVDGVEGPVRREDPRIEEIRTAKERYFTKLRETRGVDPILPIAMGQVLAEELPGDALVINDEGFMVPGMVFTESKYPSGYASPVGFHYASLGSTLPVAIGAKMADPDRAVVSFGGDAGFFYDCGELATLAQHDIGVIVIINNNSGLYGGTRGRPEGGGQFGPSISPFHVYSDSDFASVARGFGVQAERVTSYDDFAPAVRRALASGGPYLIDVVSGGSTLDVFGLFDGTPPAKFGHADPTSEGSWPS